MQCQLKNKKILENFPKLSWLGRSVPKLPAKQVFGFKIIKNILIFEHTFLALL